MIFVKDDKKDYVTFSEKKKRAKRENSTHHLKAALLTLYKKINLKETAGRFANCHRLALGLSACLIVIITVIPKFSSSVLRLFIKKTNIIGLFPI